MAGPGYRVFKRKKNGRELGPWQLRVFVPKALQTQMDGRKEIVESLKTGDRREADRAAIQRVAAIQADWKAGEAPQALSHSVPAIVLKRVYEPILATLEAARRSLPDDDHAHAEQLNRREAELRRLARWKDTDRRDQWEAVADRIITGGLISFSKGSPEYDAFVDAIGEGTLDAYSVQTRRASGDLNAEPRTKTIQAAVEQKANEARPGETLEELFEQWAAERLAKSEKRKDTVNQDRIAIKQFAAFVGPKLSISSITAQMIYDYRQTLRNLPPKWSMQKELKHLGIREAAAKARKLNLPYMAFTTVNKHLSTISPLYKWLAAQPAWVGLANPCNGLFHDKVKGKNRRPSFSTSHLNKILSSHLFTGFEQDGKEHLPGKQRADDWRHWIPLICLLTGARLGEVAQLRVEDVREERGVWFIHIRNDLSTGQTTKSGLSRAVPIHAKLIEVGFLDFHERQVIRAGIDRNGAMFPELQRNSRGQISGAVGRWWRRYLEAIGVKRGRDGFGSHSFRHTMADRLRSEAELLDDQLEVVLGHNQKTTTAGYGQLPQGTVTLLKSYFDRVRFEGVKMDHLKPKPTLTGSPIGSSI